MPLEALTKLRPAQPRAFVPQNADLGDWNQVEPLFEKLKAQASSVRTPRELERWVLNASELGAALDQEGSTRYVSMTCHTDDAETEKAFLHFIEHLEPKAKPHWHKIKEIFLSIPAHKKLPQKRWQVFTRAVKNDVELFRPENVALQVEESKLDQQYQKIMAAMTVQFQDKEQTLQQMGRYLEETDRSLRQNAWELIAKRRLQDKDKIEQIFDELLKLRTKIATNAGLKNFRDFAFRVRGRFDYTPKECEAFHDAVAELAVPLARDLQKRRQKLLGVDKLRPWDLGVDVRNRPPLRPFNDCKTLVDKCHGIFKKIDPALAKDFNVMRQHNLLDLDSRKGKAPGGYQCSLEEARLPFIFMNAVGLHRDVETMLHEAGHAFHALAARSEPVLAYRSAPIEFCEVASMSMELLGAPHLTEFYTPEEAARARRTHLEGIIALLPWVATIDAFQHWIYTHAGHNSEQRKTQWLKLRKRFGGIEDYSGYEDALAYMWHRQGHLFGMPFYYIEYGIAQLGALQLWLRSKKNVADAVRHYRKALALGGSRPLPELFKAAKIKFDFSAKTVKPLIKEIQKELKELDDA
ncbi:MAG TPA: M3 family oligoendopeptidase [Planctomycetota bacterium]|nr:M3 family oligoendopeptidase [Planctomycetota bacterium]